MGCNSSMPSNKNDDKNHEMNMHSVNPGIKIHTVVSEALDFDHDAALIIPMGEVSDDQLLAEVARRKLDLHDKITDAFVKETYELQKTIGHGASGQVYLAKHKKNGQKFACKIINKDGNMNDAQSMSTEIEIMKRVRHRHVCSMFELYESPKCLWIILELVDGGDLHKLLATTKHYSEDLASRHMEQMLKGLHYLHSLGVIHRDLKLENILLKGHGDSCEVKIADFGLSALVRLGEGGYAGGNESTKRKNYRGLTDMWGTKEMFAPELIDQAYGPQADMWSLGCILYEMLCGHQAFPIRPNDTEKTLYGRIKKGEYSMSSNEWVHVSVEAKDLLKHMLKVNPVDRLSATEALQHPWITRKGHTKEHQKHLHGTQQNLEVNYRKKNENVDSSHGKKGLSWYRRSVSMITNSVHSVPPESPAHKSPSRF